MTPKPSKPPPKAIAHRPPPPKPKQPIGFFGTLLLTVGAVAFGAYALDWHGHTCDACGKRWRHLGAFNLGDENAHTCASCGAVQWWKCGLPNVFSGRFKSSPVIAAARQEIREDPSLTIPWPPERR